MTLNEQVKNTIQEVIDRLLVVSSNADDQSQLAIAEELKDCLSRLKAVLTTINNSERVK